MHAQLVNLSVRMQGANRDDSVGIPLVCAVADIGVAEYDVILPVEVVHKLHVMAVADTVTGCAVNVCEVGTRFGDHKTDGNGLEDVGNIPVCNVEANTAAVGPVSDISQDIVVTPTPAVVSCDMYSVGVEESKKVTHHMSEFGDWFNDLPGVCDTVVHQIPTTADFGTRQIRPCQVLDVVQNDMDRQTQDLLNMGLCRLSDISIFSPIVCVTIENNGVRITGDSQDLNSYTVSDACPRSTHDVRDTRIRLFKWPRMPFRFKNPKDAFARTV